MFDSDEPRRAGGSLEAYLEMAQEYYARDDLATAMRVVEDAFESRGWPPGEWTEFYNALQCENDARDASRVYPVDDRLSIELDRTAPRDLLDSIASAALDARERVAVVLEVEFSRPALITVFLPDAPLEFISGPHGYVERKRDIDKICLPRQDVESPREAYSALVHEFVHAATGALAGEDVPAWMDEGLAEFIEDRADDRRSRFIVNAAARSGRLLSVDALESALGSRDLRIDSPATVEAAYLLARSLIDLWVERFGLASVRRALELIGEGQSPPAAARAATGVSLPELERDWRDRLRARLH